jgi:hypothetical protein
MQLAHQDRAAADLNQLQVAMPDHARLADLHRIADPLITRQRQSVFLNTILST